MNITDYRRRPPGRGRRARVFPIAEIGIDAPMLAAGAVPGCIRFAGVATDPARAVSARSAGATRIPARTGDGWRGPGDRDDGGAVR